MDRIGVLIATVGVTLACASGGSSTADDTTATRPSSNRDLITLEELQAVTATNAYDAISRLRPAWLRARGRTGLPAVFIDEQRAGDIERLRSVSIQNVQELRFIRASDATTRWGTGFQAGVIQVIQRR